jgi:hypothetical protein
MNPPTAKGFVSIPSSHSVDETVKRFKTLLDTKGVALFAVVDHSGEADKAGMKMPSTKLLIFRKKKPATGAGFCVGSDWISLRMFPLSPSLTRGGVMPDGGSVNNRPWSHPERTDCNRPNPDKQ